MMGKCLTITVLLITVIVAVIFSGFFSPPDDEIPPEVDGWFGRGPPQPETDTTIRKFRVEIPDPVLKDLQGRLNNSRLGEDLEDMNFEYGFQVNYMEKVLEYWIMKYNWRQQEAELNKFPQYKTKIEGIDVHFIHIKPKTNTGRVLLMTHGWPGSVWEFYKALPMLTEPQKYGGQASDAFEVICPSIAGYGFSEAPHQTDYNARATARIHRKLMKRLGHTKFYIQGGDWGSFVSTIMAKVYPDAIQGVHLNMFTARQRHLPTFLRLVIGSYFPSLVGVTPEEYDLHYPLSRIFLKLLKITGYMHLQATKPDTVAFALNDSPVGLAAYILEKFSGWTNEEWSSLPDGGLTKKFTLDELLTNVMIYWVTGNIGPSMRYYKENQGRGSEELSAIDGVPVTVPTALASFGDDIFHGAPLSILKLAFRNVIQTNNLPRGGHFAAFEEPRLFADDVLEFVNRVEKLDQKK